MAVRRKASLALVELRNQERYRFPVSLQREHPQIRLRFRVIRLIQQEASVARPTRGELILTRLEQYFLVFPTLRWLLIQVVGAVPVGAKYDAASIR